MPERAIGLHLDEARRVEIERGGEFRRAVVGHRRAAAAILMHQKFRIAGAAFGEALGQHLARFGIGERHAHAAHAVADEFRILAENADGDVRRLGLRQRGAAKGEGEKGRRQKPCRAHRIASHP